MTRPPLRLALLLGAALAGCRPATPVLPPEPTGPPWFRDVSAEVGLDFVHDAGPVNTYFMPQIMGSGAALFDADGDGRLDILLLQSGTVAANAVNRLYRQGADG